jgi:hypothetical protein
VLTLPELELGQLIKDPHFTLFESVGALEVSNVGAFGMINCLNG